MSRFKLTEKEEAARDRLCLPLDVKSYAKAVGLVDELYEVVGMFKVRPALYLKKEGHNIIQYVHDRGSRVFLDFKHHDIPNSVKDDAESATELGVYMFNVHASGTSAMMRNAVKLAGEVAKDLGSTRPKVVAVTVLTSINQKTLNEELLVPGTVADYVRHLGKLAESSGLDGIVCSAQEVAEVKKNFRNDFMYVTPGIQGIGMTVGADQQRVATPGNAIRDGSSILVAGRTITTVKDKSHGEDRGATPDEMRDNAYNILKDMAEAL